MSRYQTIQKAANDMGVNESLIQSLLKNKELNKYRLKGRRRVLIDTDELNMLIVLDDGTETSTLNLENFEV